MVVSSSSTSSLEASVVAKYEGYTNDGLRDAIKSVVQGKGKAAIKGLSKLNKAQLIELAEAEGVNNNNNHSLASGSTDSTASTSGRSVSDSGVKGKGKEVSEGNTSEPSVADLSKKVDTLTREFNSLKAQLSSRDTTTSQPMAKNVEESYGEYTIDEIKKKLDELKVEYKKSEKKAYYMELAARCQLPSKSKQSKA